MPGDTPTVHLVGPTPERLVAALGRIEQFDFALVGGLAVMTRIGSAHRATDDLDGVFDNPAADTTAVLVRYGIADNDPAIQRVRIDGTKIDVIDTTPLPDDPGDLPDDPKGRLFVCAHRWAYDTATPVRLVAGDAAVTVRVAVPDALVAMKSHALRWATAQRRSTKRTSDLHDLYRLAALDQSGEPLLAAPWSLATQVANALAEDLGSGAQAAALLRSSATPDVAEIDPDDFIEITLDLIARLGSPGT